MNRLVIFLSVVLLVACKQNEKKNPDTDYKLVWEDQFDGNSINTEDWNIVNWPAGRVNNEWQQYVDDTIHHKLENGKLYITATKTGENEKGGYTASRFNTKGKKEFKYGRIEFKAKMPKGRGTWPALWMLGSNIDTVRWAKCGEIDVMEYVGYQPDTTHTNVHTNYQHGVTDFHKTIPLETAEEDFHVYGLTWTKDTLKFYLDDPKNITNIYAPEVKNEDNWPFDQKFYLIMNFAVGGNWGGKFGVDETIFPQSMIVDYVKVYQKLD